MASPFWSKKTNRRAIRRLAQAGHLTIFVGAGASMEVGFPSWGALLQDLLRKVASDAGLEPDKWPSFCDGVLEAEGFLGAASIVRASLGDRFVSVMQSELYREVGADPVPGPSARAVASVVSTWGVENTTVVTTNYDRLLERALEEQEGIAAVRSISSAEELAAGGDRGECQVVHLHGLVTPTGSSKEVVLAEADYFDMQEPNQWQERFFQKQLNETTCLFVGASMSDPNLLRYIWRARSSHWSEVSELEEPRHVAVLVSQGDVWSRDSDMPESVEQLRRTTGLRRWRTVGVQPVEADFYVQSAQFIFEVELARRLGPTYADYRKRLNDWEKQQRSALLLDDPPDDFIKNQNAVQGLLKEWLSTVVDLLRNADLLDDKERLGLHLWLRQPSSRSLVQWGSSDRSWRDPKTLQPVPIAADSAWCALRAFCAGTPVFEDKPGGTTRWRFIYGIPVHLENEPFYRLPVAVLTLASTQGRPRSSLAQLRPEMKDEIWAYLTQNAAQLADPSVDDVETGSAVGDGSPTEAPVEEDGDGNEDS